MSLRVVHISFLPAFFCPIANPPALGAMLGWFVTLSVLLR